MSIHFSGVPETLCSVTPQHASKGSPAYYPVTLTVCAVTAVLVPMSVVANAFILAAIWKSPSLRTPSHVLLAGLGVTDFCTGLLTLPAYVVAKVSELAGNREINYLANPVADVLAFYFSSLTGFVIMLSSVERWLYLSRRPLLTVCRVVTLYIMSASFLLIIIAGVTCAWYFCNACWYQFFTKLLYIFHSLAATAVVVTGLAYFKVFQIIRNHQRQVETNQSNFNMRKYRKSIFTVLYIFIIFVITYAPIMCCVLAFNTVQEYGENYAVYIVCVALLFSSSLFNPLLYYWRIKEIRDSVKSIIRNIFCQQNGDES